jgi:hypothetical protein
VQHLREVLYDGLKLHLLLNSRNASNLTAKEAKLSTKESELIKLRHLHELPNIVLGTYGIASN